MSQMKKVVRKLNMREKKRRAAQGERMMEGSGMIARRES